MKKSTLRILRILLIVGGVLVLLSMIALAKVIYLEGIINPDQSLSLTKITVLLFYPGLILCAPYTIAVLKNDWNEMWKGSKKKRNWWNDDF